MLFANKTAMRIAKCPECGRGVIDAYTNSDLLHCSSCHSTFIKSTDEKSTYSKLREKIHSSYNSNFHDYSMPTSVMLWIRELCDLIDSEKVK